MAQVRVQIKGLKKFRKLVSSLPKSVFSEVQKGIREAAFIVEKKSKIAISTGRTRAIDTGNLRSSIRVAEVKPFRAEIRPTANYGIYVHEGTRRMRPRPFMTIGLKDSVRDIEKILNQRVKIGIEKKL